MIVSSTPSFAVRKSTAAHLDAVHSWQHPVEKHQVRFPVGKVAQCLAAVSGNKRVIAFIDKTFLEESVDAWLVLYY